jgi:hypothetical protein
MKTALDKIGLTFVLAAVFFTTWTHEGFRSAVREAKDFAAHDM